MREVEPPFELEYKGKAFTVTEAEIRNRRIFHMQIPGEKRVLTITVGKGPREEKFWTSVPEGRQQEAEEVGKLIAEYIRRKKK